MAPVVDDSTKERAETKSRNAKKNISDDTQWLTSAEVMHLEHEYGAHK
jgi:hypothetical protein